MESLNEVWVTAFLNFVSPPPRWLISSPRPFSPPTCTCAEEVLCFSRHLAFLRTRSFYPFPPPTPSRPSAWERQNFLSFLERLPEVPAGQLAHAEAGRIEGSSASCCFRPERCRVWRPPARPRLRRRRRSRWSRAAPARRPRKHAMRGQCAGVGGGGRQACAFFRWLCCLPRLELVSPSLCRAALF